LTANSDVRDVTVGMTPDKRKEKWNDMMSVSQISANSSVIKVSIVAKREVDAQQLVKKTSRTLLDTVAFYYNIKNDVDLRIIEGPISKPQVSNWNLLLLFSIVIGFSIAALLSFLPFLRTALVKIKAPENAGYPFTPKPFFDFNNKNKEVVPLEKELESLENLFTNDQLAESFATDETSEIVDDNFSEMKKKTKKLEPDKYPNFPEMPARNAAHGVVDGPVSYIEPGVPFNLPIADEDFSNMFPSPVEDFPVKEEIAIAPVETEKSTKSEPTKEELKKRLNELLRGNI
jgi:hypothetical protein